MYRKVFSLFKMTTFDKTYSNKNEIFALCSKYTTSQDFMTGSSLVQLFHQIIGDSKLLSEPFTISPTLEPHGFKAELSH